MLISSKSAKNPPIAFCPIVYCLGIPPHYMPCNVYMVYIVDHTAITSIIDYNTPCNNLPSSLLPPLSSLPPFPLPPFLPSSLPPFPLPPPQVIKGPLFRLIFAEKENKSWCL